MATQPSSTSFPMPAQPCRLLSLDALRGFNMIWILGIDELVRAWYGFDHGVLARSVLFELDHAPWAGFRFYDLIFPLFIFMVGAALVFSLGKIIETEGKGAALRRLLVRSTLLYLLGILYYGGLSKTIGDIRLLGVLQRIALSYLFAGLAFILIRRKGEVYRPGLWTALAALLIGYWALMTFVPVPGFYAGNYAEGKNLANYIDKMYLPFFKWDGDHDPEGLLSTLPAIGTCLMGVLAGLLLRDPAISSQKKVYWLAGAGAAALAAGGLWSVQFPVIKKIWTSSYVLVAGGCSLLLLGLFYQVIEIWHKRRWAMPFVWIGANAITLYLLVNFVNFKELAGLFAGGPVKQAIGRPGDTLLWAIAVALAWAMAYFLYQKKIFLRL